jgi:hypothetical protein
MTLKGGDVMILKLALALVMVGGVSAGLLTGTHATQAVPTCSEELGITHHGIHITRDYVVGADGTGPGGEGAEVPGGPGPGFHFPNGFAPGASFCNDQASSPGVHF